MQSRGGGRRKGGDDKGQRGRNLLEVGRQAATESEREGACVMCVTLNE